MFSCFLRLPPQGVDILADASDTLGQISGSIASITGDQHFQMRSASRRMVEETSMGGALLHGGEAMAAGLFRGITGADSRVGSGGGRPPRAARGFESLWAPLAEPRLGPRARR